MHKIAVYSYEWSDLLDFEAAKDYIEQRQYLNSSKSLLSHTVEAYVRRNEHLEKFRQNFLAKSEKPQSMLEAILAEKVPSLFEWHKFLQAELLMPLFRETGLGFVSPWTQTIIVYLLLFIPAVLYLVSRLIDHILMKLDPPPKLIGLDEDGSPPMLTPLTTSSNTMLPKQTIASQQKTQSLLHQ